MDHKEALQALSPAQVRDLTARNNWAGLLHLAVHFGAILLTGTLIAVQVPFWPMLLPVHGILLVFLFTLEHEATHQTPFAARWLNEASGHAAGLLLFLPFTWFRYFHLAHHRHTNDPKHDPELLSGGHPLTRAAFLWHVSGLPYWGGMLRVLVQNAVGSTAAPFLPKATLPRVQREARILLTTYLALGLTLSVSPLIFWVWIVPILLGQPALRLYLLAEHGRCPQVANMFENTRTTFTNRALRFLAWNMPYHAEHHTMPNVPFHRLPALHETLAPHLKRTEPSYRSFTQKFMQTLR